MPDPAGRTVLFATGDRPACTGAGRCLAASCTQSAMTAHAAPAARTVTAPARPRVNGSFRSAANPAATNRSASRTAALDELQAENRDVWPYECAFGIASTNTFSTTPTTKAAAAS